MQAKVYRVAFAQIYECPHCQAIRTLELKPNRIFCGGVKCEEGEDPHLHVTCHGCGFRFIMDTAANPTVAAAPSECAEAPRG